MKVLIFQFNAHQLFKLYSITGKVIMNCDSERDECKDLNIFESTISLWLEERNE